MKIALAFLAMLAPLFASGCDGETDDDACDCSPLEPDCPASPVPCGQKTPPKAPR